MQTLGSRRQRVRIACSVSMSRTGPSGPCVRVVITVSSVTQELRIDTDIHHCFSVAIEIQLLSLRDEHHYIQLRELCKTTFGHIMHENHQGDTI